MASKKSNLTIQFSTRAERDLEDIWEWNSHRYSGEHADAYRNFLLEQLTKLSTEKIKGRVVPERNYLRYILIQRRSRNHGHVAVYQVKGDTVLILYLFHSAQDWQSKI